MNKLFMLFCISLVVFACNNASNKPADETTAVAAADGNKILRGEEVDETAAITVPDMLKLMQGKEKLPVTISAAIEECCQKKGCWMKVQKGNGETMMVTFKDYGFFVPMESAGKTAIMKGFAYFDTVSVEMLKHYAKMPASPNQKLMLLLNPNSTLLSKPAV
jgi:hypothetical protein